MHKPRIFMKGGWWRVSPMTWRRTPKALDLWHKAHAFIGPKNAALHAIKHPPKKAPDA